MGTTVKPEEKAKSAVAEIAKTVTNALAKLATALGAAVTSTVTATVTFALQARKDAGEGGVEVGKSLIKGAIIQAAGMSGAAEVMQIAYLQTKGVAPVVSRLVRLAFPKTPEASKELDLAIAFNAKQTNPYKAIGMENLLDIARGNITFQAVIDGKAVQSSRKARTPGETKLTLDKDSRKGLSEGVTRLLKGYVGKDRLTVEQATAILADCMAKRAAELKS